jgi:hypothetical protein
MSAEQIGTGLDFASDFTLRLREFTLSTYNNLPNTIFITALLLGAIQGNLPMIWVAMGMIINAMTVTSLQEVLGLLFPKWNQVHQPASATCSIVPDFDPASNPTLIIAPSHWFAATSYFVVFILFNAIQVMIRPVAQGADPTKVDVRIAFTGSVVMLSIFFFAILLLRGFTGCETWLGSILGILVGSGVAVGYWYLLDVCHSGVPPDILNVVAATAPARPNDGETPVICSAN